MKSVAGFLRMPAVAASVLVFAALLAARAESVPAAGPAAAAQVAGPVVTIAIEGPINPATDDFLKYAVKKAQEERARLLVIRLNTPGGLISSMQAMVATLLESPVPTAIYVAPGGASATSAGVFITLAGNLAVMAPGTTIGAAHPVLGSGGDLSGDMREKIENFTVSLIKAIAEQRGRNVAWAEEAVRESVSITDREAMEKGVIDFTASDLERVLAQSEGRTVTVAGKPVTLTNLANAPRKTIEMSFKQQLVNVLADPNIAVLLGLGAMLGIGMELYHPGGIVPGVIGAICLLLSLVSSQVIPISYGGVGLLILGMAFFAVELFMPSFGIWGAAGIVSLVLGAIYFVDTDAVWSAEGFAVDPLFVGAIAVIVGTLLLGAVFLAVSATSRKVTTGIEGLIGRRARARDDFARDEASGQIRGKVDVMGEIWHGRVEGMEPPVKGQLLTVAAVEPGMVLLLNEFKEEINRGPEKGQSK